MNGLNQILTAGQLGIGYDGRGNLTSSGTSAYGYNADNLLVSGPGGATLAYDPLGRLAQTMGNGLTTRFGYDGADLIAEYNGARLPSPSAGAGGCNTMLRRYVHGPGSDEPIVWYDGASTANRRELRRQFSKYTHYANHRRWSAFPGSSFPARCAGHRGSSSGALWPVCRFCGFGTG